MWLNLVIFHKYMTAVKVDKICQIFQNWPSDDTQINVSTTGQNQQSGQIPLTID